MKIILRLVLFLISLLLFTAKSFSQQWPKNSNNDFIKVDSLANKAKPKEALAIINSLNTQARKDGNTVLLIKSAMYRMMFQSYLAEDALTKILIDLKEDIHGAKQPEKSVLQSLLAETYWRYYQQNRYRIFRRTEVQANIDNDINLWSAKKIADETVKTLLLSLSKKELLQDTKIGVLNNLLLGDTTTRSLRPTLYDLLAHRALDILMNTEVDLAKTADTGVDFTNPVLFGDYKTFMSIKLTVNDSTSFAAEKIKIFQNLLQFHSIHYNEAALADADLKRLKFIYERSTGLNKRADYLKAIRLLATKATKTEIYADLLYEQALFYKNDELRLYGQLSASSPYDRNPDLIKAVELANKAIAAFPKSNGAINAANLIKDIKDKTLGIELKEFSQPGRPSQLFFSYKNIDTIHLQVYKVPAEFSYYSGYEGKQEYQEFLQNHKAVKSWSVILPRLVDYQPHTLIDKMDGFPEGNYIVLVQNTMDTSRADRIIQRANFKVTSIAATHRFIHNTNEYFLADRLTGTPLKDVSIQEIVTEFKGNQGINYNGEKVKTDGLGYAISKEVRGVQYARIINGSDTLCMSVNNYRNNYKPELKRVVLFTDRSIYRPGQTVFYKGLFMQTELDRNSIIPAQSIALKFKDANYKDIEEVTVTTNDYGTFQGSFVIPAGKLNGSMLLSTDYGSISVQVEEYKRPAFEIAFDPLNQKYKLNDSIKVQGKASSFSGYPVTGATVNYKVYRSRITDYFRSYQTDSPKQIAIGTTKTKEGGGFEITFFAAGDPNTYVNYTFRITADITDLNGETRTASKSINAGEIDLVLNAALPDQLFLKSKTDSIPFIIQNLNGEPIAAKVQAEWTALKYPGRLINRSVFASIAENYTLNKENFLKIFPDEEYKGDGNPKNWGPLKQSFIQNIAVSKGKGALALNEKSLSPGYYKVKLIAQNSQNDTLSQTSIVRIYTDERTAILRMNEWLVAEKTTIAPSESAIFRIAGALPGARAYYEIYYKDKIIEKVWIKTSQKQTIIKVPQKPGFENSFAVQFTMIQNGEVYNSLQNVNIIDPSKELSISFLTFRNKLQPGEKESWKLKISNKKGEKQMAEMVATLYDVSLDKLKKMDWADINAPYYNYTAYQWDFNVNKIGYGTELWFLRRYPDYFRAKQRNYEHLNAFGFETGGGAYNYRSYLQGLARQERMGNSAVAIRKLEKLQSGQERYGVISDSEGYAVPGALVRIGKLKVFTDANGIYNMKGQLGDELKVSAIGYQIFTLKLTQIRREDIILENETNGLSEISVMPSPKQKKEITSSAVMIRGLSSASAGLSTERATLHEIRTERIAEDSKVYDFVSIADTYDAKNDIYIINGKPVRGASKIIPRTNFNETAFFYPQLKTNDAGEINIEFTIPQSLTRFKMMGFAHTKDLKTATIERELITQKQLAISINAPRFFREGDTILLIGKLNNLSGKALNGNASLELRDALTGRIIQILAAGGKSAQEFKVADKSNEILKWPLIIPSGVNAITYKVLAQSGKYSDGEEMTVPVLSNAMLVTETMPLNVRGNTSKTFTFDKLLKSGSSKTLKNQALTLEFTANPIWYAIQSLPYLMEYPYECAEQTFSRFYANSFATGIINSSPKIKQVFNQWQQTNNGEALLSNLEKNQELKSILLEETPWVSAAASQTEQKKRLAILFDLNRMSYELKTNFEKLEKMQKPNGSFAWFTGMSDDRYITQHIVLGMGQLKHLKLIDEKVFPAFNVTLNKAIIYLDNQLKDDFKKEVKGKGIAYLPLHYLYGRSYTAQKNDDPEFRKAIAFYLKKVADNWNTMEPYQQGQAALVLSRNGNKTEALKIINLLKERAQQNDELGMYWVNNRNGWWWYQNPIETQALLIEAFDEVAEDSRSVEEMKIWLLKNKQTNDWKTTKATAAACYALLRKGYNLLEEPAEPEILIGNKTFGETGLADSPKEAGTGYQKVIITGVNVKPEMGTVKVKNNNKTIAWGGVYWQYFEQLDKITPAQTGVRIKKQLFIQKQTTKGDVLTPLNANNVLTPGDLLKVRIEIYADRDMEYVHLKDMRSSGFEPVNVISRYKYQDGLGYYESTKDASTNFFISYLRKGVYVFEYALRVTHAGDFSNGITSLQCMYAPEFTTHSEGVRIKVKP